MQTLEEVRTRCRRWRRYVLNADTGGDMYKMQTLEETRTRCRHWRRYVLNADTGGDMYKMQTLEEIHTRFRYWRRYERDADTGGDTYPHNLKSLQHSPYQMGNLHKWTHYISQVLCDERKLLETYMYL